MPNQIVLVGPNHTGMGPALSIMNKGLWEMPTTNFKIDAALATAIMERCPELKADTRAHAKEHSLEVQLPFIAHHAPEALIVPIAIGGDGAESLQSLGEAIASAVTESEGDTLIVASTDMSHFIPEEDARARDKLAIDKVLALDPEGLVDVVLKEGISMCGVLPTYVVLIAALTLGATRASLVKYTTSAEVSGDAKSVVGYAGLVIS